MIQKVNSNQLNRFNIMTKGTLAQKKQWLGESARQNWNYHNPNSRIESTTASKELQDAVKSDLFTQRLFDALKNTTKKIIG